MSKASAAKSARRSKRRAARDQTWISAPVGERLADELEIARELEDFDARLTARGWGFSEDADDSVDADDEVAVAWYWPPSAAELEDAAEVADVAERVTATVVLLTPDDGAEIAHVVFVGTSEDYQFGLEELFDHIDIVEAYRVGEPLPTFAS